MNAIKYRRLEQPGCAQNKQRYMIKKVLKRNPRDKNPFGR